VERAAATGRYDGILPRSLALRCSDVPDPEQSLKDLVKVSLIIDRGSEVEAVEIEGFLPPERSRPENLLPRKRANTAEYRRKKCARGDHDRHCPSATCPAKIAAHNQAANEAVTGRVTGNPGTGRVGSGRVGGPPTNLIEKKEEPPEPGSGTNGWPEGSIGRGENEE
jgi:hypothetical protein